MFSTDLLQHPFTDSPQPKLPDRNRDFLLRTQVPFCRLNRRVAEQELDLLEIPTGFAAEPGTDAPEVVGPEVPPRSPCRPRGPRPNRPVTQAGAHGAALADLGRYRLLEWEEYEELLRAVSVRHTPLRAASVMISVNTGMRLMEQHRLRWSQVNMERRMERRQTTLLRTKNREQRPIPMNSAVYEALLIIRPLKPRTELVFPRPRGGNTTVINERFIEIVKTLGFEDHTWHNNRQSFCPWPAIAGVPLPTIQESAGHKSISITSLLALVSRSQDLGDR